MASSQESRIPAREGSEATKENADEEASMAAAAQVEGLTSTRSASPMRSSSTRKFFQDKVHEVVRLTRYGQWDFDFSRSPGAEHTAVAEDVTPAPLTVPPWGPVSAKEIFTGILRPNYDDPRSPPSMRA